MTLTHAPILETRAQEWHDEAACAASAATLARNPALRDAYVELQGELGAGKTTFCLLYTSDAADDM
jgi:tRNA threonylcarbamoyladenosine biosynthesis protein TsaE